VWTIQLTAAAAAAAAEELRALAEGQRAHVEHLDGPLWETRLKGASGIARALYVTRRPQRVVVLRVLVKKTQKTPRREIDIALKRAEEVT
jgi:phage-related protein